MTEDWARRRRRSLLLVVVLAVVAGVYSAFQRPVALFPDIPFPRIVVSINSGDRPVGRMIVEVTQPVESALRNVPNVQDVRSTTSRGSADLSVNFAWGTDMVAALLQIEAAVSRALPALPPGTKFEARRMNPTVFPMLGLALTARGGDPVRLRDFAYYELRRELLLIPGVAHVEVLGGRQAEYQVALDPAKLRAFGLSVNEVSAALAGANTVTAVGRLEDYYRLYLVLADAPLRTLADIRNTILRSGPMGVMTLGDVAEVTQGTVSEWTTVTANGREAVLVDVFQQPSANTVAIASGVTASLEALKARTPANVKITRYYDQSALVIASAKSVRDAIIIGSILAAIVLFLFLWNWRVTLIIGVMLPSVLAITVLMLKLLNLPFDMMTLGGMAAAVGLVVDDGVVMLEHITRRVAEAKKGTHGPAVFAGAMEMARPLTGSSLATVIIFLPLAFLSGVSGGFFKVLALTMVSALFISYFVAMFAVPLVAELLLSNAPPERKPHRLQEWVKHRYDRTIRAVLGRPLWILPVIAVLCGVGYFAFLHVGTGFMPPTDEGGFILDYKAPAGTSLTETNRLLAKVERIITATPEVDGYSRRTGLQLGGGLTEANSGDFFIHLKPPPRRPIEAVMSSVRQQALQEAPSLQLETAQLVEDLIGDLTAVPQPIEVKLFGNDPAGLQSLAPTVAAAVGKVSGVVEVKNGIVIAGDALDIEVDRVRTSLEGLDPAKITAQLQTEIGGTVASEIPAQQKLIGVRVWLPASVRDRVGQLERLQLRAPDGHYVPLRRIASIRTVAGQAEVTRENGKPMVAVTARIEGRDLGSTMTDVQGAVARLQLPAGVHVEYGGLFREQQRSSRDLLMVFVSAVVLVFVLLIFVYERFAVAIAIVLTTLLALSGVFVGLWLTGTQRNISAMMGMTMVIGMITEIAIFYFAELDLDTRPDPDALAKAGVNRLRAILMSASIAVLALLPLALGIGAGSGMQKPLAIAIIAGLVTAVPLVLFVMPALYSLILRVGPRRPS